MTSVQRFGRFGADEAQSDAGNQEEAKPYQPLQILGGIREKGFDGDGGPVGGKPRRVALPQPSVRPFPVARHRSDGPHWAPKSQLEPETVPMPDDLEELGAEGLASLAKPLIRKKKPSLNLSRWKKELLEGLKEQPASTSLRIEEVTAEEEPKAEEAPEAVARPRVTFTVPTRESADEALKPVDYGEQSRLRSDSGAISRGEVRVTGVETPRSEAQQASIDEENRGAIAAMSAAQVAEAQAEIISRLKPEVLQMLRTRGLKKGLKEYDTEEGKQVLKHEPVKSPVIGENSESPAGSVETGDKNKEAGDISVPRVEQGSGWPKSWTERVESVRLLRFDMEGHLLTIDETPIQESDGASQELQQSIAERDFLRSEGDPAAMGYTLKEAADLVRSTVAGHRTFALRLIASVLENAVVGLQEPKATACSDQSPKTLSDVDWQAVWAYALGPEPGLTLTLRLALDDTHTTVVVSCARALQALLSCSANNAIFDLHESSWPRMKLLYTGPVFRKPTKQDEGFIGGGRWKYNIKASELYPNMKDGNSAEEDADGKETVGDDATVASKDVAAGLIRMGLLPRIRYILEVEKLRAAEDQLMDVVVALARHSPAASEAVMKCPRLVDSIIQRFILANEDRDGGVQFVQSCRAKAIGLLKVLSQAHRLNCSKFFNSGAIQMAQSELYAQEPSDWAGDTSRSTVVESLRLWQICIQYKMGMSSFMDIYPSLCFWLSPLSEQEILNGSTHNAALGLAQESYRLLQLLAQTLPNLHPSDAETLESFETDEEPEKWAWSVAVPLVETALGWLSAERLAAIVERLGRFGESGASSANLVLTLTAVLQFLSTVCGRILGSSDDDDDDGGKGAPDAQSPFIPTFVPRLGLLLAADKFVVSQSGTPTVFGSLCSMRHVKDEETTVAATSCLQAMVRLLNNVDQVIKTARAASATPPASGDCNQAHKTLDVGLVVSCRRELQELLSDVGEEVLANTGLLPSFEINGRGGPAPGVGIGWGAASGGSWGRKALVAQGTARLVLHLLDVTHPSAAAAPARTRDVKSSDSEMLWRLSCGFSVAALATPEDGELVKQACSKILIHPRTLSALSDPREATLTELGSVLKDLSLSRESLAKLAPEKVSQILLEHYTWTWTSRKKRKTAPNGTKGILKGRSAAGPKLPTVLENTGAYARTSLAKEWARQRLPLPCHWILSPMATNITRLLFQADGEEGVGVASVDETDRALMEGTVKAGLSWLLGLEALYWGSSKRTSHHPFHLIPLVRKVHALSCVYVLGGDIFLHEETRTAVAVLQEIYGRELQPEAEPEENGGRRDVGLDFERLIDMNYTSFGESLAEQFGASSFGDRVFGRQVAFYLQQGVPDAPRLALWRIVADAQALKLLPPLAHCCGPPSRYLFPFERNAEIVGVYVTAWTSGALDTPAAQASLSFSLCLHHIAGYLFATSPAVQDPLAVKTAARTLVRSSMRKSHQQAALVKLVMYEPPPPPYPLETTSMGYKELENRVAFLSEACQGDRTLLSQVERLHRLIL